MKSEDEEQLEKT